MTTLWVYYDKKSSWIQLVQKSIQDFYKQYSRIITINVLILIL